MATQRHFAHDTATETGTDGALVRDLLTSADTGTLVSQSVNDTAFIECQRWIRTVGTALLNGSATWVAQIDVASISGSINGRFRLQRRNSSGVVQSSSAYSTTFSTTGVKTLNTTWNPGTWAAGDRLAISVEIQRSGGHGNVNITFTLASTHTDAQLAAGNNFQETLSTSIAASTTAVEDLSMAETLASSILGSTATADVQAMAESLSTSVTATTTVGDTYTPAGGGDFPDVDGRTTSVTDTPGSTNHVVDLPDGISTGKRVWVGVCFDRMEGTVTWPTDWVELADLDDGAGRSRLVVAYKDVDGTEGFTGTGDTITVVSSVTDESTHASILVSNQGATAPEAQQAAGNDTSPNPPALAPTGGAKNFLWLIFAGSRNGADFTAYPANYINGQTIQASTAGDNSSIASAERDLNAASEDPGILTIDVARPWTAVTVVNFPTAGGGSSFSETLSTSISGSTSVLDTVASSESLSTAIVASTVETETQGHSEPLVTSIVATTTSNDQLSGSFFETLSTTIVASTISNDVLTATDPLSTSIAASTTSNDTVSGSETLQTSIVANTTAQEQLGMSETLQTLVVGDSNITDVAAYVELLDTDIVVTTTSQDSMTGSFTESLSTSIAATTTANDVAALNEPLETSIVASSTEADDLSMFESLQTSIVSDIIETDQLGMSESLATSIVGTTTTGDVGTFNDALTTSIVGSTEVTDSVTGSFVESLTTSISGSTTIFDALTTGEALSTSISGSTIESDSQGRYESLATSIAFGSSLQDMASFYDSLLTAIAATTTADDTKASDFVPELSFEEQLPGVFRARQHTSFQGPENPTYKGKA